MFKVPQHEKVQSLQSTSKVALKCQSLGSFKVTNKLGKNRSTAPIRDKTEPGDSEIRAKSKVNSRN